METSEIKKNVREGYAAVAKQGATCCGSGSSCCGTNAPGSVSSAIGYSADDLASVPDGANLGLGCGNPIALASLKEGEIVLDLGSGAGFDCFLAAKRVGSLGRVIGVDMTPEMLDRARENALRGDYKNVEFRLGEIENLPVADNSVDAIISNCVINLSPDKPRVFAEAFRVLKPGGRVMVSDIVLLAALPEAVRNSVEAYVSCIAGAMRIDEYLRTIRDAGFKDVKIVEETTFPVDFITDDPTAQAIIKDNNITQEAVDGFAKSVLSVRVQATRPHSN
jgi:arsenite methyltransferase